MRRHSSRPPGPPEIQIGQPSFPFVSSCNHERPPQSSCCGGFVSSLSGWLGFGSGHHFPSIEGQLCAVYSFSVPMVGLGLEGSDADDPGGAELCSFAPWDVSMLPDEGFISPIGLASLAAPDAGGAELCSLAPVD